MADGPFDPQTGELISREPTLEDLVDLCRTLLERGARFLVVGGFAIRAHGLARNTGAVDLLMDSSLENEARVFDALATLPDGCVRELKPGEVAKYTLVRAWPTTFSWTSWQVLQASPTRRHCMALSSARLTAHPFPLPALNCFIG